MLHVLLVSFIVVRKWFKMKELSAMSIHLKTKGAQDTLLRTSECIKEVPLLRVLTDEDYNNLPGYWHA